MNQLAESRDLTRNTVRIRISQLSRNIALPAALVLMGMLSFGQSGRVINDRNAEKRDVKGFHGVSISGGIDLYLTQGNEEGVAISSSDPSALRKIRTEVEN